MEANRHWRGSPENCSTGLKGETVLHASEWQPLRTAPRDGSKLDVWTENGFRYIDVFWYQGPAYPEGAFVYYDSNLRDIIDVDDATHWMPPPAPPRHEKAAHSEDGSLICAAE
jgi:hypothetical protein